MAWMILPGITSALVSITILFFTFRADIPITLHPPADLSPSSAVKNWPRTVVAVSSMVLCLVMLAVTSIWHTPVWIVTLPIAVFMFACDVASDVLGWSKESVKKKEGSDEVNVIPMQELSTEESNIVVMRAVEIPSQDQVEANSNSQQNMVVASQVSIHTSHKHSYLSRRFPTTSKALRRIPWSICPFIFSMFILVQALIHTSWVTKLSEAFAYTISTSSNPVAVSVFGIGSISALACCLLNNQPMSILFSSILSDVAFMDGIALVKDSASVVKACYFALIVGSNLGGNLMIHAALAGFMWKEILDREGIKIGGWLFMWYALLSVMPSLMTACFVLWLEISGFSNV
jgi:arsenical pump membrane protein